MIIPLCGLPRSGSTLLANVLRQNPEIKGGQTSGLIDLVLAVRQQWDHLVDFKASPDDQKKHAAIKGLIDGYCGKGLAIDKSRAWPHYIELLRAIYPDIKLIATVRDIREILASFERLWRKNYIRHDDMTDDDRMKCATLNGRLNYWLRYDKPTGLAISWLSDAIDRGHRDIIHIVHYDDLIDRPKETIDGIYDFLGIERFPHHFEKIEQVIKENDFMHNSPGLHDIKPVLKRPESYKETIGDLADNVAWINDKWR